MGGLSDSTSHSCASPASASATLQQPRGDRVAVHAREQPQPHLHHAAFGHDVDGGAAVDAPDVEGRPRHLGEVSELGSRSSSSRGAARRGRPPAALRLDRVVPQVR